MKRKARATRAVALALLVAAALALPGVASTARADGFELGYNQAWIEGGWGRDLSSGFDAAAWRRVLERTRQGGGSVLRVWLFEGRDLEGVVWDGHRPARVDPSMLEAVRALSALAAEIGVQLYWTATDGNWFWETRGLEYDRVWNVYNDRWGYGRAFRENVLGPVVSAVMERPETVWGFDVVNELQGPVGKWLFPDGWDGARRYVRETAAFLHARAPGLRVTASSGHHTAASDILRGRFDGLGLDFLDVHFYEDGARIPDGDDLVAHARRRGVPIVVGELGQSKKQVDDAHQARVVRELVADAHRRGFAGVFVWRLEDEQEDGRRFSFFDGDRPRPALEEMRRLAERLAPLPPRPAPPPATPPAKDGSGREGPVSGEQREAARDARGLVDALRDGGDRDR